MGVCRWGRTLGLIGLLPWPALAAPVECAAIKNDLDRLACYDREVGRTPVAQALPSKGKWIVRSEKSVLDDREQVFLSVASDGPVNCGWNRNAPIDLMVRCMDNTTSLIISTGCHMTSSRYNDYGHVTYRLDSDQARTVEMNESTNNRSLGLWSGGRSIPVIKQMFGKSKMIVRMTPFGESPFTATFPIGGLEEVIAPLRKACNW